MDDLMPTTFRRRAIPRGELPQTASGKQRMPRRPEMPYYRFLTELRRRDAARSDEQRALCDLAILNIRKSYQP